MLAIGGGLLSEPKMLMLDEPSLGLAPKLIPEIFYLVKRLKDKGTSILLVEQNVRESLQVAKRGCIVREGRIVLSDDCDFLSKSADLRKTYLRA